MELLKIFLSAILLAGVAMMALVSGTIVGDMIGKIFDKLKGE